MACFNNEQYQILANDLIGDIFYTSTSYRGKNFHFKTVCRDNYSENFRY